MLTICSVPQINRTTFTAKRKIHSFRVETQLSQIDTLSEQAAIGNSNWVCVMSKPCDLLTGQTSRVHKATSPQSCFALEVSIGRGPKPYDAVVVASINSFSIWAEITSKDTLVTLGQCGTQFCTISIPKLSNAIRTTGKQGVPIPIQRCFFEHSPTHSYWLKEWRGMLAQIKYCHCDRFT